MNVVYGENAGKQWTRCNVDRDGMETRREDGGVLLPDIDNDAFPFSTLLAPSVPYALIASPIASHTLDN